MSDPSMSLQLNQTGVARELVRRDQFDDHESEAVPRKDLLTRLREYLRKCYVRGLTQVQ